MAINHVFNHKVMASHEVRKEVERNRGLEKTSSSTSHLAWNHSSAVPKLLRLRAVATCLGGLGPKGGKESMAGTGVDSE